jgi:hypothetical protein
MINRMAILLEKCTSNFTSALFLSFANAITEHKQPGDHGNDY